MQKLGVYMHIPFCVRKCLYCDFVSYAGCQELVPAYFTALKRELDWYRRAGLFAHYTVTTLYVGGGTPSLTADELTTWLADSAAILFSPALQEVTVEVNPGTISGPQLVRLRQAGVQRLSIGAQSFRDTELARLGRIHSAADTRACLQAARQAGFTNLSLDLMFGIPDGDISDWHASLESVLELQPEHLSLYNLTIEADTPFEREERHDRLRMPDESLQLDLYRSGIATLTKAGYEHYEISNFARPGCRSRHNQLYWRNEEYLGLGAGAHSYLKGRRAWNQIDMHEYIHACSPESTRGRGNPYSDHSPAQAGQERLSLQGTVGETLMMNLRLLEGLDIPAFERRFGVSVERLYADELQRLYALNLLERTGHRLRLTSQGLVLSNEVFREFLNAG